MLISTTVRAVELCLLSECLEGQDQCQEPDNINCGDNLCPTLINNFIKIKGSNTTFNSFVLLGYDFTYPYTDDGHFRCNKHID